MLFERIELVNFASYYGEQTIDIETTPEKPVVVILGGTGFGKTTIFDAINWALYGGEYELSLVKRRQRKIEDYVNQKAIREAYEKNESVEMSCTLYFEHESTHYYISQSLCVKPTKHQNGDISAVQTDRMTALYRITPGGDHVHLEYSTIFLDETLPSNVKDYFLFDGDRIYQLSKPGSSQEVRDAIYRVIDLELIKNANTHLEQVAAEYRRDAKKQTSGELSTVTADLIVERENLSRLKKSLADNREEERALKAQIEVIENRLRELPDTSKLQSRKDELELQLSRIEEQIDDKVLAIRRNCAVSSLAVAREPMLALIAELDTRRQKGLIPRNVSKSLLNDLLQMRKCLCGTKFEEGDEIFQQLTKRLEEESNRSTGQEFIDLLFKIRSTSDDVVDATNRLRELYGEYNRLSDYKQELSIAIKQTSSDLDKLPKEDINALTNELRDRNNAVITVEKNITIISYKIEECDKRIKDLETRSEQLGKKQEEYKRMQRREYLAQQAADRLDEIYDKFAEDSRKQIEDLTKKEFKQFVQAASAYDVALDENYELQVLDPNGNRALQRLSMGQSQCLSLSFITAISRVSEKNPPLVIDMPFGRLDRDVHNAVSARLPELASQLILFLIPDIEWNEVTANNLLPKASHIYRLLFNKEEQVTEIVKA